VDDNIEIRSAQLDQVRFSERLIDLIVMPYGVEAMVPHDGRMVREICERGAFERISAERRRFSVNRGHNLDALVGKAISFDPDAEDGLRATVRISPTLLGDETLQLAADGLLDASAGFIPKQDSWHEGLSLRRILKAWLHHIALVPDPAYADARVLAVRANDPAPGPAAAGSTPLLDEVRSWKLRERFATIDAE
jgi:HK97 family phage prohead protease